MHLLLIFLLQSLYFATTLRLKVLKCKMYCVLLLQVDGGQLVLTLVRGKMKNTVQQSDFWVSQALVR